MKHACIRIQTLSHTHLQQERRPFHPCYPGGDSHENSDRCGRKVTTYQILRLHLKWKKRINITSLSLIQMWRTGPNLDPIHIPSIEYILWQRVLDDQAFSSCDHNLVHPFSDILYSFPFVFDDVLNMPLDLLQAMLKVAFTKRQWPVDQRLAIEIKQIENLD